ncbi:hypothetical protein AE618_08800 [Bosea vaviloviae]|uniref:Uncharacterized protein n=1 Tax=Bosea vaviloviae TaxID=1526658 RepID=A0A0N1F5L3_9HYPH|nr:hypothetical protein AE618_08800 [Bosea vaviloviae]
MMRLLEDHESEASNPSENGEAILLEEVHALAASLGVEPERAIRALSIVIRRRTAFERLKRSANEPLRGAHR